MKKFILKLYLLISLLAPTTLAAEGSSFLTIDQAKLTQTTSKSTRFKTFCLNNLKAMSYGIKNFVIDIAKQELLRGTNSSIQRITARKLIGPGNYRFINLTSGTDATTAINDHIKKRLSYSLQSKINIDLQSLVKTEKHLEILKKIAEEWVKEKFPDVTINFTEIKSTNAKDFLDQLLILLKDKKLDPSEKSNIERSLERIWTKNILKFYEYESLNQEEQDDYTKKSSFYKYLEEHKNELNSELIKHIPRAKGIATILSGPIATAIIHNACKIGQEAYNESKIANLSRTDSLINAAKAEKNIIAVLKDPDIPVQILEQILPTSEDSYSSIMWKILLKNHLTSEEVNRSIRTISFGSSLGSFISDIYSGNILSSCFSGIETILSGLMIKEKLFNFTTATLKPHLNIIKLIKNYLHTKNIGLLIPLVEQVTLLT